MGCGSSSETPVTEITNNNVTVVEVENDTEVHSSKEESLGDELKEDTEEGGKIEDEPDNEAVQEGEDLAVEDVVEEELASEEPAEMAEAAEAEEAADAAEEASE